MDILTRTHPQSLIWRTYTAFMLVVVGLYHVRHLPSYTSALGLISSIVILMGLAALTEWAFGFRSGTKMLRRLIAAIFSLTTVWAVFQVAWHLLEGGPSTGGWPAIAASWTAVFFYIPMCIALFRHASDDGSRAARTVEIASDISPSRLRALNRHRGP
jgi:hypothetical protein